MLRVIVSRDSDEEIKIADLIPPKIRLYNLRCFKKAIDKLIFFELIIDLFSLREIKISNFKLIDMQINFGRWNSLNRITIKSYKYYLNKLNFYRFVYIY